MKIKPSPTLFILGMGLTAFLIAGCELPTDQSSKSQAGSESAKVKKPQSGDTTAKLDGPVRPQPIDPSHVIPFYPDSIATIHDTTGDPKGPGCGPVLPQPINPGNIFPLDTDKVSTNAPGTVSTPSDLPPGCQRVGYADGKDHHPGDGYAGPYSGTVVCPITVPTP